MFRRATYILAITAFVAVVACLAVPSSSDAARPVKGSFYDANVSTGLYAITTPNTISTLQLYCGGNRYDVAHALGVRRNGSFRYRGVAYGYGDGGRPTGTFKLSLSGRFTSPTRIKLKRAIQGCTTSTAKAAATRG